MRKSFEIFNGGKRKSYKIFFLFFSLGALNLSLLSTGSSPVVTSSGSKVEEGILQGSMVALENTEKIETFVVQIKNSFPDISSAIKKIVALEELVEEKEEIYSRTLSKEVLLYLFGFKWLWGIFTGYRNTFVTPAWNELQQAKAKLGSSQLQLEKIKNTITETAELVKESLKNFGGTTQNVKLNLAAQRAKTKLELIRHQLEYLVKRLFDEARNELVFQKASSLGRKSEYYNSSYASNFGSSNSDVNVESRTETGLDTATRQIWEKAEVERWMQKRKEFKEEVERARADFENTSKLEEYVDLLQEVILAGKKESKKQANAK